MKETTTLTTFLRRFAITLSATATLATGTAFAVDWTPPLGIPDPGFGIHSTHRMYAEPGQTFDFGAGPVPYPSTANGPYTHYVDVSHAAATDSANPFGTPSRPRKTIPLNVPPGSVIEIHGGPYNQGTINGNGYVGVTGIGTASKPIFVRGASGNEKPVITRTLLTYGAHLTLENLQFDNATVYIRADLSEGKVDSHHLVFRHLTMKGDSTAKGANAAIAGLGNWRDPSLPAVRNVVVWNNTISDYGDWLQSASENDFQGVEVNGYGASDIWIVDNSIHHMGGDSIRVGSNPTGYPYDARRVYIGRNHLYDNHENALDVKGIFDVVVSQNKMHGFSAVPSDPGTAVAVHYDCGNIWFVGNEIHDAVKGIVVSGALDIYVIGNEIHDVGQAIEFWSNNEIHFVSNTVSRMATGVSDLGAAPLPHPVINNIFTGLTDKASGYHVKMQSNAANVSEMRNNLIYEPDSTFRVHWGATYNSLGALKSGSRKAQDCVTDNPMFVDVSGADFRLETASAARGAGTPLDYYINLFASRFSSTLSTDLAGISRSTNRAVNIGAHECFRPDGPSNLKVVAQ